MLFFLYRLCVWTISKISFLDLISKWSSHTYLVNIEKFNSALSVVRSKIGKIHICVIRDMIIGYILHIHIYTWKACTLVHYFWNSVNFHFKFKSIIYFANYFLWPRAICMENWWFGFKTVVLWQSFRKKKSAFPLLVC